MKKAILYLLPLLSNISGFSQNNYTVTVPEKTHEITYGHLNLGGKNPAGTPIEFKRYFMSLDNKPFITIMVEMHFSRFSDQYWK